MLRSFRCKETEKIFNREFSKKLPKDIRRIGLRKLLHIHAAVDVNDLRAPPGNKLEKLKGNRKGRHSIRINDQWRICFRFENSNAKDVEIVDYH